MADLSQLRSEIDRIDIQLFELFSQRVDVARRIGDYKRERGLAVFDPTRERQKVANAGGRVPPELSTYAQVLMGAPHGGRPQPGGGSRGPRRR